MQNTFPDVFFIILLDFMPDFVAVRKMLFRLFAEYQIIALS